MRTRHAGFSRSGFQAWRFGVRVALTRGLLALAILLLAPAGAWAQLANGEPANLFEMTTFASGITEPIDVEFLPDGRALVIRRNGVIAVVNADGTQQNNAGTIPGTLNTGAGEQGLLGVALDPNFADNRTLYFYVSLSRDKDGNTISSANRHHVQKGVIAAASNSFTWGDYVVATGLEGPANHNGGTVIVHKNQLYVSVGDTGANATPPQNHYSSCLNKANGKVLRINLDGTVPSDNPLSNLATVTGCDSTGGPFGDRAPDKRVWAWGFRNPFRIWIDPKTDLMWAGDVGEGTREEITVGAAGTHHGYPFHEGTVDYNQPWNIECTGMTPSRACTDPVFDYPHANGDNCVIGGLIPEGCGWPAAYTQKYFFGDHGSRRIYTLNVNAARTGLATNTRSTFATLAGGMSAFKMGHDHSLYVVSDQGNAVFKITPKNRPSSCTNNAGNEDGGVDAMPDAELDAGSSPDVEVDGPVLAPLFDAAADRANDRPVDGPSPSDARATDVRAGDAPGADGPFAPVTDAARGAGDMAGPGGLPGAGGMPGGGGAGGMADGAASGGLGGRGGAGGAPGAGGAAGSSSGGSGAGNDAGAARKRAADSGCGCRLAESGRSSRDTGVAWLVLSLAGAFFGRRRARRP